VLVRAAQARVISLVVSEPLLAEVERVLQYPSFGVSASTARRMVKAVRGIATVVDIPKRLAILTTDPDDNIVLETAFVGKADMLATANLAHFEEVRSRAAKALRFRGVDIVSLSRCHERIRHEWPEAHELLHKVWGWSP
jgi:putative PIN family toxin of toxin-antitoxin system